MAKNSSNMNASKKNAYGQSDKNESNRNSSDSNCHGYKERQ